MSDQSSYQKTRQAIRQDSLTFNRPSNYHFSRDNAGWVEAEASQLRELVQTLTADSAILRQEVDLLREVIVECYNGNKTRFNRIAGELALNVRR